MPGRLKICRSCGQAAIPTLTHGDLLKAMSEVHGDLTAAPLPNRTAADQPGDDDPELLRHRRDRALTTLRWAISEAVRTECFQCERSEQLSHRRQR